MSVSTASINVLDLLKKRFTVGIYTVKEQYVMKF